MQVIRTQGFKYHDYREIVAYFYNMCDGCHFLWEGRNKLPAIKSCVYNEMKAKSTEVNEFDQSDRQMDEAYILMLMLTHMVVSHSGYCEYTDGNISKSRGDTLRSGNKTYIIDCFGGYKLLSDIMGIGQTNELGEVPDNYLSELNKMPQKKYFIDNEALDPDKHHYYIGKLNFAENKFWLKSIVNPTIRYSPAISFADIIPKCEVKEFPVSVVSHNVTLRDRSTNFPSIYDSYAYEAGSFVPHFELPVVMQIVKHVGMEILEVRTENGLIVIDLNVVYYDILRSGQISAKCSDKEGLAGYFYFTNINWQFA